MSLLENLTWRYATKKMNGKAVPQEKVDYILEAARLSPSSSGLQPYRIIVVTDPEIKEKIKPIAWDQSQITDASHILVFAAWEKYTEDRIKEVFHNTLTARGLPLDKMDAYRERLWGMYSQLPEEWHAHHAAKQAYIAFGTAIVAAAEQKVDATPMEGFDPAALDELLGLKELGLKSAVVLPLGYRDEENDWLSGMKKFRTPKEEFVISSAEILEK
ncbi:NAD(P)H-dependent oxidoreductase [Echinicola soli]|uniref:NAD(P)H-dependent oxidoreductase n=1 Tax=Echinicola soli TaxID=2591634 RepID=A0A514CFQ2_9BACT|nr:NAD(P)H-dependent oxidoreductase [Echinicola soli]QDH78651.1 NAD(P)H-dependent oxidoreductase [Echinicola soli]